MATQGGGDVGMAGAAQQAEAGVATGGEDGGGVAGADLAAVFVQGHITHPMQAVLNLPVAAPQRQQPGGIGLLRRPAGQREGHFVGGLARPHAADVLHLAHDAADLPQPWPSPNAQILVRAHGGGGVCRVVGAYRHAQVGDHVARRLQRPPLLAVAMPVARHHPPARRPRIGEAERHCRPHERLVALQDDEIVPLFCTIARQSAQCASKASPVSTRPLSSRAGHSASAALLPASSCPLPRVVASASTTRVWWAKAATQWTPGSSSPWIPRKVLPSSASASSGWRPCSANQVPSTRSKAAWSRWPNARWRVATLGPRSRRSPRAARSSGPPSRPHWLMAYKLRLPHRSAHTANASIPPSGCTRPCARRTSGNVSSAARSDPAGA